MGHLHGVTLDTQVDKLAANVHTLPAVRRGVPDGSELSSKDRQEQGPVELGECWAELREHRTFFEFDRIQVEMLTPPNATSCSPVLTPGAV